MALNNGLEMIEWLRKNFNTITPTHALALKATRHLRKSEKKYLFSEDISLMRTAEGRWYEGLIYEMMILAASKCKYVKGMIRKGADAPYTRHKLSQHQNGTFYSNYGDIKVRGNGQDLAEVDLVLVDQENTVAFAEIITSPADLKDFEQEIIFKKRLIGYLYGQPLVPFILVSSVDISRNTIVQRIMKEPDSVLIVTPSCEEIKKMLNPREIRYRPRKPIAHQKLIPLADVSPKRPFDYRELHDRRREQMIALMDEGAPCEALTAPDEIPPIVKKIVFGALHPPAIKYLFERTKVTIKGEPLTYDEVMKRFSKVIVAVNLPECRPILYFRSRKKKEYFKMVPAKVGGFKYESRRTPHMAGFFLWLESTRPTLGTRKTRILLDYFVRDEKKEAVKKKSPSKRSKRPKRTKKRKK
ncbi:hypothetical protein J2129_000491 [Methanofollis sp. W23]|uniref:hypothetical protein n=1 Tax=Methanofollis sp. W23 TaxID=2817849 RepID=UPI001AEB9C87|nr:hypothetical protein [Methanofollis sp. W23]MBP2145037.1 hypothetical protein [Methanofollis sp. W23]